jgi:hypothetical protein
MIFQDAKFHEKKVEKDKTTDEMPTQSEKEKKR